VVRKLRLHRGGRCGAGKARVQGKAPEVRSAPGLQGAATAGQKPDRGAQALKY
jgi:hypothetical protein